MVKVLFLIYSENVSSMRNRIIQCELTSFVHRALQRTRQPTHVIFEQRMYGASVKTWPPQGQYRSDGGLKERKGFFFDMVHDIY